MQIGIIMLWNSFEFPVAETENMKGQMLYRTEGYKSARTSVQNGNIEMNSSLHSDVSFWQIIEGSL